MEGPVTYTAPRLSGDSTLAQAYGQKLLDLSGNTRMNVNQAIIEPIPADSTFGQWWSHFSDILQNPIFKKWAERNHLDTSKPFSLIPSLGALRGNVAGTTKTLFLERDSALASLYAPLINAARVVGAGSHIVAAPLAANRASVADVADFYHESIPDTPDDLKQRGQALLNIRAFTAPSARFAEVRQDSALTYQRNLVGDIHDREALASKLQQFPENGSQPLQAYLKNNTLRVHSNSSYDQTHNLPEGNTVSLEQFITDNHWRLPTDRQQLANLIRVLEAPPLPAPHHGDLGGALSWPVPLTQDEQKLVYSHFNHNLRLPGLKDIALDPKGALGYLSQNRHWTDAERRDPRKVIEQIIHSPKAKELGVALQTKMGGVPTKDSQTDWVLAAIANTLDTESLFRPRKHHVAGFDLANGQHYGKPLEHIRQQLTAHVVSTGKATPQMAPIAAYLLLNRSAPELLVKDVPQDVTYGSIAWVSLKAAVARIEAQSPGAAALMSFAQIVSQDAKEPISEDDETIQQQTMLPALAEWGEINGTLPQSTTGVYSAAQLEQTQTTLREKGEALNKAAQSLQAEMPTQRSVALDELKKVFGDGIPFERKCISSTYANSDAHQLTASITTESVGTYSLLDLYLSQRAADRVGWTSSDRDVPVTGLLDRMSRLPDPKAKHAQAFADYQKGIEEAYSVQTRLLLSKLPLQDRKNLEYGKITVYVEGEVTRSRHVLPNGTVDHESNFPEQPLRERSLLIKTKHNGEQAFYEISPQRGYLLRRDDLKDRFKEGVQAPWVKQPAPYGEKQSTTAIQEKKPANEQERSQMAATEHSNDTPDSFFSPRSRLIGQLLSRHTCEAFKFDRALEASKAVTTFDEEQARKKMAEELWLGVIPFASATRHVINGNYLDAAGDLIFDGVMYATSLGLGKGTGAVKGLPKPKRLFGKTLLAGKLPTSTLARAARAPIAEAGQWISHPISRVVEGLRPSSRRTVDLLEMSRRPDIAQGTYKIIGSETPLKTTALYDDATRKWFAYDIHTQQRSGLPLHDFSPQSSRAIDTPTPGSTALKPNHLEASLARDNVVELGGTMRELTRLEGDLYCFVDTYKGVDRLNICAHGVGLDLIDRLKNNPTTMYFNNSENTPAQLLNALKNKNIDPSLYDNVRLVMCYSANGQSNSFAADFQRLVKRPVKAFEGPVTANFEPNDMTNLFAHAEKTLPATWQQDLKTVFARQRQMKVYKSRQHINAFKDPATFIRFSYTPRYFSQVIAPIPPPLP